MKGIINKENYKEFKMGIKSKNLFIMKDKGINIPDFFCIDDKWKEDEVKDFIKFQFKNTKLFSVRSSSSVEDGINASFAGQFSTYLSVEKDKITKYINKCFEYKKDNKVQDYCSANKINIDNMYMNIIVQEMIEADYSGVIFTANPQGILNEAVIVIGEGVGNNVVDNKVDTTSYYYNLSDNKYYYETQGNSKVLDYTIIDELIEVSRKIEAIFGSYLDIEFAIKNKNIYILQSRPITTIREDHKKIVLDNSNIVESYPKITLPLTESFIKESYYKVFRSLLTRLSREKKTVEQNDEILRNMLNVANGRVYYRISSWYDIILFLPFNKKIIPVWQEMMGITEKEVISNLGKKVDKLTYLKVTYSFINLIITSPKKMNNLNEYFDNMIGDIYTKLKKCNKNNDLIKIYKDLEEDIIKRWDITLVNDMYSFIFTGLLKFQLKKKKVKDYEAKTNMLISNISNLESMKPIEELISIAKYIKEINICSELKDITTNEEYYTYINEEKNKKVKEVFSNYIQVYGDRNIDELKLESKTFRTDPSLFIKKILGYVEDDNLNNLLQKSEKSNLSNYELSKLGKFYLNKAALGIRNRERSRLNRGRLYGIMRTIILNISENFVYDNKIEKREDIFYLYYDEVQDTINGKDIDLKKLIKERKEEYDIYNMLPSYSRLIFKDKVINKKPLNINSVSRRSTNDIILGIPCSTGIVEGEVVVIEDYDETIDIKDKILVTKTTDPGWIFLIVRAKGIIAEKGSLLSHTAIISRELQKPSVVGIKDITELLKTGDYISLNGENGEIRIINRI